MKYYIYSITNKINQKKYIGQTINYEKRMKEHLYGRKDGRNPIIDKEIQQYNKDNFVFQIIDIAENSEKANELERKYIKDLGTLIPNRIQCLKGWSIRTRCLEYETYFSV